ncbi:MAG: 23S rRNA (uracil(1939)-C(5))-methyltransferase RlmD, partial [Pseudomonadota bacterium]
GYRRSARLAARFVPGKGGMLVGFRERAGNKVVLMDTCPVLDERVQSVLAALGPVLGRLSAPRAVPQIQVAAGEREVALVLRHLEPLTPSDEDLLGRFGDEHRVTWLLQSGGPDTLRPLSGSMMPALSYRHPAFSVELSFDASDFIQINATVNERLVTTAVSWLAPTAGDRVLDAFCGIGNFTLALATRAGEVLGVEGDSTLVNRAQDNAQLNRIANAQFAVANLYDADMEAAVLERPYDAMVIDPPRSGAEAFVQAMTTNPPPRVVYVSCEPTTLARDADYLVNTLGYRVGRAGIADMFPHTNHVESVVLFLK